MVCFVAVLDLHIGYSLFMVFGMLGLENFPRTALQRRSKTFHAQSEERGCAIHPEGNKCTFANELGLALAGTDPRLGSGGWMV